MYQLIQYFEKRKKRKSLVFGSFFSLKWVTTCERAGGKTNEPMHRCRHAN